MPTLVTHYFEVMSRLSQVQTATHRLLETGFIIREVRLGFPRPVIWVAYTPACYQLYDDPYTRPVAMRRRRTNKGVERTMASLVAGCQVQWMVTRPAPLNPLSHLLPTNGGTHARIELPDWTHHGREALG